MWLPNCLEMAGDIQALPTVVTGGGDLLVKVVMLACAIMQKAGCLHYYPHEVIL
jgi:hypothetical protein